MKTALNKHSTFWEICKKIFSLALPMSGSQFINVASGFLCMAMLAHLGHEVLAASSLIFTTQMSIMVTGMSILFSLSVLVGHAYGAKEYRTAGNFLQQGWTLALLISVPVMILFWHMGSLLILFGQSKEMAAIVEPYFHVFAFAVIPGYLSTCNMQFGYGIHRKTLMFLGSVLSVAVLLISAYALIFGKLGMPRMGVTGLGIAIVAQYSFFFIFSTLFFYCNKSYKHFELFKYRVHQHLGHFIQMFKIGWPICQP